MEITLPVSSLSGPHHIPPQDPTSSFFSTPSALLLFPFCWLIFLLHSISVFLTLCPLALFSLGAFGLALLLLLSLCPPSYSLSFLSASYCIYLPCLSLIVSLYLFFLLLLALAVFFSSQLPRSPSLSPLWAACQLLFPGVEPLPSSTPIPRLLLPPPSLPLSPLPLIDGPSIRKGEEGKERKRKRDEKELQSTKTYTEAHNVTHPYIPSTVLSKCSSLCTWKRPQTVVHTALLEKGHTEKSTQTEQG
uniref:PPUP9078 n=1 Tax=Poeciliopsis prolifica TaxID=188132 RepID=A0A0S7EJI1_9TELE